MSGNYEQSKNFQASLVATAPSPATSGTSLVVTAGEGTLFDTPSFNAIVCPANAQPTAANAEIVRVTGKSTDTFTITRAQEGSSARSIVVGDRIFVGPTANTWTITDSIITLVNAGLSQKVSALQADAKGDMWAASAADSPARFGPVGANETVVVADSAQTLGVKWAVPIAGSRNWHPILTLPTTPRGTGATALTRATVNIGAGAFVSSGGNDALHIMVPIFAADLNLTGRTTKLKCRAVVGTGNTSPNMNFTVGLSLVATSAGPANDQQNFTWSTSVTGADKLLAINNTTTINTINGDAFDLPADGWYVIHLTTSATNPTNCRWNAGLSLLMSHV